MPAMVLPFEPTPLNLVMVIAAFFAAGLSKGVIGVGIPLIAVPVLSGVMHPASIISVLALPIVLSNIWQAIDGRRFGLTFRRFWPATITIVIGSAIGAQFITTIDPKQAQLVLGIVVLLYSGSQLLKVRIPAPPPATEKIWTAIVGFISGCLGGFAAYFGPPMIMYLLALRVTKDEFISGAAMLYLIGATPLFVILAWKGVLAGPELTLSAAGSVVILGAMFFGRWLRERISQEVFRKALLVVLLVMAMNMLRRALF